MILVTGATGLADSALLFELAATGEKVRGLKRPESRMSRVEARFKNNPELISNVEWVDGDVTDIFSLDEAFQDVTHVYHCAAQVSFQPADRNRMQHTNISGTANVVNL